MACGIHAISEIMKKTLRAKSASMRGGERRMGEGILYIFCNVHLPRFCFSASYVTEVNSRKVYLRAFFFFLSLSSCLLCENERWFVYFANTNIRHCSMPGRWTNLCKAWARLRRCLS